MFDWIERVMQALNEAERAAAGKATYQDVEQELGRLEAAVEAAIAKDQSEADSFWTELGRLAKHGFNFFTERSRFYAQAEQVKADARGARAEASAFIRARVGQHATVPDRLEQDARAWGRSRQQVDSLALRAGKLREVAGWRGEAHDGYVAAATVQHSALQELSGVMASTAQGCVAGATLNRAIFYMVAKYVRRAINAIEAAPGSSGDSYYLRTVEARNQCTSLRSSVAGALSGQVAAGSATNLALQLANTVTMPNLLEPGTWPTGTSGASTAPADTGDGVTGNGDDGNLNSQGGNEQCSPGVNL